MALLYLNTHAWNPLSCQVTFLFSPTGNSPFFYSSSQNIFGLHCTPWSGKDVSDPLKKKKKSRNRCQKYKLDSFTPLGHVAIGSRHLHRPITHRHHEHHWTSKPKCQKHKPMTLVGEQWPSLCWMMSSNWLVWLGWRMKIQHQTKTNKTHEN